MSPSEVMKVLRYKILIPMLLFAILGAYALLIEPNIILVRHIKIVSSKLASSLNGIKVVHISDLDIESVGYRERSFIDKINGLNADLILFTGDFIGGKTADYHKAITVIKGIKDKDRVWAIMGDSDYWMEDSSKLIKELRTMGIKVLINESAEISLKNGFKVALAGVDDLTSAKTDIKLALRNLPADMPVILLTHSIQAVVNKADGITVNTVSNKEFRHGHSLKDEWTGWRWESYDNETKGPAATYFENDGEHTMRVQMRECGIRIDQIILKAVNDNAKPGSVESQDGAETVISAGDISKADIHGTWRKFEDNTAYCRFRMDDHVHDVIENVPLIKPQNYFDIKFKAKKGIRYSVHLRTQSHAECNGSVWIQFNDSIDKDGQPRYRIARFDPTIKLENVNLVLSGHTHGGQIIFPWWRIFSDRIYKGGLNYIKGLYSFRGIPIYISSGIGLSHVPVRFMVPPEIAILEFTE